MANNNVLGLQPMRKDESGFTRHDLSHFFGYKCSTGHIVPIVSDILNPNERIKLKVNTFIRMQPLVTPAMQQLDVYIDYFFVPMPMILMDFERQFSQTKEIFTSFIQPSGNIAQRKFPLFNGMLANTFPFERFNAQNPNKFTLQYSEDVQSQWDTNYDNDLYDCFESVGSRMIRLFDYLGLSFPAHFGNAASDLGTFYNNGSSSYVADDGTAMTAAQVGNKIAADMFSSYHKSFPWKLLAYNAIFQNWFRIDNRQAFDSGLFNLDKHLTTASYYSTGFYANVLQNETDDASKGRFALIQYCPKHLDYFTESSPTPVITTLNQFDVLPKNLQFLTNNSQSVFSDYGGDAFTGFDEPYFADSTGSVAVNRGSSASYPVDMDTEETSDIFIPGLSLARLRLVKAQEKMLQIYGRLPKKNYDTLVYALFGRQVPHDVKHELSHLGKEHFQINISQISAMAGSADQPLGELAGQGSGVSKSKGIKFTAPCHGIVMAVQYVKPNYMYYDGFMRHNNITSYDDLFLPPYDNLGRQPVYSWELNDSAMHTGIAWQYRWQEMKSQYNRVSRAFKYGTERSWFVVQDSSEIIENTPGSYKLCNQFFYVSPLSLNDIMVQQYVPWFMSEALTASKQADGETWADQENWFINPSLVFARDPMICISRIDYSKFSKMSRYSLQTID